MYDPIVLVQVDVPFAQVAVPDVHSFTSCQEKKKERRKISKPPSSDQKKKKKKKKMKTNFRKGYSPVQTVPLPE